MRAVSCPLSVLNKYVFIFFYLGIRFRDLHVLRLLAN